MKIAVVIVTKDYFPEHDQNWRTAFITLTETQLAELALRPNEGVYEISEVKTDD
jgi:hypothetical protein